MCDIEKYTNKKTITKDYFGKTVIDEYAWIEDLSDESKDYTETENNITDDYMKKSACYNEYKKSIAEVMKKGLALVKKRDNLLYALKVDEFDNRAIISSYDCFKTYDTIICDDELKSDSKIEDYSISKDNESMAVISKNLWSVNSEAHFLNISEKKITAQLNQCAQVVFFGKNDFFAQIKADLNDFSQTNSVITGCVIKGEISNMSTVFEVPEMNSMEIVISEDEKYVFLNILTDYYENDNIYCKKIDDNVNNEFERVLKEISGRIFYIGSDEKNHYFQTNNNAPNYKIISLPADNMKFENIAEAIEEDENKPAAKARRSAFKIKDKVIIIEKAIRGHIFKIVDIHSKNKTYISPNSENVYFNNLYNVCVEASSEIYFTQESVINYISLYKLNVETTETEMLYTAKTCEDIDIEKIEFNDSIIAAVRKKGVKNSRIIISFNWGYDSDFAFNTSNFNIKTHAVKWAEEGNTYAEYNLPLFTPDNAESIFDEIDKLIDFLIEKGITEKGKIGLLDGGYMHNASQIYCIKRQERVKALCTVGDRKDFLRYTNDITSYMFKDAIGDACESKEKFEELYKYSPYHNVREDIKYPAHLIMCNDYSMLVPSYHSKKMAAALKKTKREETILLRCFSEENDKEMIAEMFTFFYNELGKGDSRK